MDRQKVLSVARELFVKEGYQAVTVRRIANTLGYTHGALYYHFKDKAALIHELLKHDFAYMERKIREVLEKDEIPPLDRLRACILTFIRFGLEHPHHYQLMFIEKEVTLTVYQLEEANTVFQLLLQGVLLSKEHLQLSPPNQLAWLIFLATHGFISRNILDGGKWPDLEALAETFVEMILKGLQR